MRTSKTGWKRYLTWERWQFLYLVLSISWLLGPPLNHGPSTQGAFISQYEDPGQPWSWLFRACDVLAALLLGLAVVVIARRWRRGRPDGRVYAWSLALLGIIALGSLVDVLFPSACHGACIMPESLLKAVHASESVITTLALLTLNVIWALKRSPWARPVLLVQLAWIAVFAFTQLTTNAGNSLVQFAYQIVVAIWVATLVPHLVDRAPPPRVDRNARLTTHLIAGWIFFGGFVAVASAVRNVKEISDLSSAYFGNNTAWLSQHGVAVGVVLMYISRHLWRGEYRAWQLASLLLWLETLKYSLVSPNASLVLLYGLTAAVLFLRRRVFDRLTSAEELKERIKKLLVVTLAVVLALVVGLIAYRYKHHQDVDALKLNAGQFTRHLFLVDVVNDLGPLPRRLLGQVLNVAGLSLLLAVLVSLFRPDRPLIRPYNEHDRENLLDLLRSNSNSSEDYFKYWPQPKSYWWSGGRRAVVTYRVAGNVAFALADPTAAPGGRRAAVQEFLEYCRRHGWRACFLMVQEDRHDLYKEAGCKLFRIGASAVVDVDEFTSKTARNKWWRWVLNKSKKQGWEYGLAKPPHSRELIAELRRVSDAWLGRENHLERGFALGYFDETYLQSCRLHLLRGGGEVIAFANELPTFNDLPTATIDLMRFRPDQNHAMPSLLAGIITQLKEDGDKREFDLGFVPLASPTARTEQIIKVLGQLLMSEAVSAQGLEQFKNKFAPSWQNNYIAFDGDWIDLINISRQLDNLLKL